MKNLSDFGVQEMTQEELVNTDGGFAWYIIPVCIGIALIMYGG